ncbi:MAG TPA: anhydro-N-acetylmuramic acid kinase [Gemmatimonadales bacterium]|nr:anhydro-N-acetylmuramic acid kinase [Gemmatimonadales bacterium]
MAEARLPVLAVGLMSGTSLDGVSAALVRIGEPAPEAYALELLAFVTTPFSDAQRDRIGNTISGGSARELALLDADLGQWFADAALAVLARGGVAPSALGFVASHGLTVWHEPQRASLQLGNAAAIAERLGVPVVSDFRSRDVAAGGHGAPLVPRADRLLFARPDGPRALLNLGGIANFTVVPARGSGVPVLALDTGPGVMVIDECVRRLFPGRRFDEDGAIARTGRAVAGVVEAGLAHPFFAEAPPRSTGREVFGVAYAHRLIAQCREHAASPADTVATAVALTARAIGEAAERFIPPQLRPLDVVRSGGGARNPALVAAVAEAWRGPEHRAFDELFFDGDAKEAAAFAFLGHLARSGRPGNEPAATGARGPRILGCLTPA